MRTKIKPHAAWLGGLAALGLAGAAVPAAAQTVLPEVTVTGQWGPYGAPRYLSAPVSYADLDLTTAWGRHELDRRIHATAEDLCRQLGEQPKAVIPPVMQSCEQQAVNSAREQQRIAYAEARPRGYAMVVPAAPPPPDEPYVAPSGANAAESYGAQASYRTETVTNGPVPDTSSNRARFGGPLSNAGRRTTPAGN